MSAVATVAINVDARDATGQLRQLREQAGQTEKAFSGLTAVVGRLAVAATAIQAARFVFAKTAELETQTRSLQVLTGSAEKAKSIIQDLQRLGAVTPFTSTELIDAAKRLQAFGIEANKVVETTKRLADVSGATSANLQELATAYGQVQAKGRLQGEELLQFQERGVALQKELQKMYGMSGEEFQKALSKGQISAQAVEVAIQRLTDAGGKYANGAIAQSDTLAGKFSTLQDGIEMLAKKVGEVLKPVLVEILNLSIAVIDSINNAIAGPSRKQANDRLYNVRAQIKSLQNQAQAAQAAGVSPTASGAGLMGVDGQVFNYGPAIPALKQQLKDLRNEEKQLQDRIKSLNTSATKPPAPKPTAIPGLLTPTTGGGTGGGKGRTGKTDAEKAADAIRQSFQDGVKLNIELDRQLKLENAANEYAKERLQIQFTYRDRLKQIGELKNKDQKLALEELAIKLRDLDLQKLATKEYAEQNRLFYERAGFTPGAPLGPGAGAFRTDINLNPLAGADPIAEYAQRLKDLMDPINQAKAGADAIGNAFNDAFSGLVTGTQTAQEALSNFFRGISNSFLQMATQMITEMIKLYVFKQLLGLFGGGAAAGGLFKGAGPISGASVFGAGQGAFNPLSFGAGVALRAMGGPVTAGQPYMVGERGPELFVPSSGGSIVPSGKGGGGVAVTVNVDAKGTSVEGSNQQASQLGRVVAAAVQAELVNQRRRGGLLNS